MTGPVSPDGVIEASMRLDTSQVSKDLERTLRQADKDTDRDTDRVGRNISHEIGAGIEHEYRAIGHSISTAIHDGVDRDRDEFRRAGRRLAHEVADGFANNLNAFQRVFQGLSQAIGPFLGSIFNVSGRSTAMFGGIIILIGAIIALVLAAIHGIRALLSLLALIPNVLFAIGLQAGALFFIFNGFFQAIGSLTAAKNIDELNQALKDTNPAMAAFIRTLWPLKELFKAISDAAKTQFFGTLGDIFTLINTAIGKQLFNSISAISQALGGMFRTILMFFTQPLFRNFMALITPEITYWLDKFGPSVVRFLEGLTRFGIATLPFLRWFGEAFNNWIASIGRWFDKLAQDPEFLAWLDRAKVTMALFIDALGAIWETIQIIARNIEKAGGDELLTSIVEQFKALNGILASDIGVKAMRAFIYTVAELLFLAVAIITAFTLFFYLLYQIFYLVGQIALGFRDLGIIIVRLIIWPFKQLASLYQDAKEAFIDFFSHWSGNWSSLGDAVVRGFFAILGVIRNFLTVTIPDEFRAWIIEARDTLYQAGKSFIQSLVDGMWAMIPGPFRTVLRYLGQQLGLVGTPQVAAAAAPTGGGGTGTGTTGTAPTTSMTAALFGPRQNSAAPSSTTTNAFGEGAVQVTINTVNPPTQTQAAAIGSGVGTGIQQQLAQRSVRTM